jgi:N-acetylmuramoyl-L-alanine amidase
VSGSRSYNRAAAIARVVAWALLIVASGGVLKATEVLAQATAAQGVVSTWGGSTEVHLAPAKKTERVRPRADRGAEAVTRAKAARGAADTATSGPANAVLGYGFDGDERRTRLTFDLGGPTEVSARSLANPPRVIIDLPETEFRLPPGAGRQGHGLVRVFRYGLIEAGKSRVVIETSGPVTVDRAELVLAEANGAFRLEIELSPTTAEQLAAAELAEAALNLRPTLPQVESRPVPRAAVPERPVIVVDAGPGGIDSGASG